MIRGVLGEDENQKGGCNEIRESKDKRMGWIWPIYNDLSRGHPKWWFSKGNPLISGKSRLVKYNNLARWDEFFPLVLPDSTLLRSCMYFGQGFLRSFHTYLLISGIGSTRDKWMIYFGYILGCPPHTGCNRHHQDWHDTFFVPYLEDRPT